MTRRLTSFLLLVVAACGSSAGPETPPESAHDLRRRHITESVQATVLLATRRADGGQRSGSGVVLGRSGDTIFIVTTAHLLTPMTAQSVTAALSPGAETLPATVLAVRKDADLALVSVRDSGPARMSGGVAMQATAQLGDSVWVVGFPWGRSSTLVNGAVSQLAAARQSPIDGAVAMVDAPVNYGSSGGGVFDASTGRLVGIVRGYRTVRMTVPGETHRALTLPVAGETTVIPAPAIACLLHEAARPLDLAGKTAGFSGRDSCGAIVTGATG